jgi:hypothetical protein
LWKKNSIKTPSTTVIETKIEVDVEKTSALVVVINNRDNF